MTHALVRLSGITHVSVCYSAQYNRVLIKISNHFFPLRASFEFLNAGVPENTPFPVQSCSGQVHPLCVSDNVYLMEDVQYRVTQILPHQQVVRSQRINTDSPFRGSWHQIGKGPPLTSDSTVS